MLKKVEHALAPYVSFIIMPVFALANAGVNLEGVSFIDLLSPVPALSVVGL